MLVIDKLRNLYPGHDIESTCNEDGYSDIELIIDNKCTGIWFDDYYLYDEYDEDNYMHQLYLKDVKEYFNDQSN